MWGGCGGARPDGNLNSFGEMAVDVVGDPARNLIEVSSAGNDLENRARQIFDECRGVGKVTAPRGLVTEIVVVVIAGETRVDTAGRDALVRTVVGLGRVCGNGTHSFCSPLSKAAQKLVNCEQYSIRTREGRKSFTAKMWITHGDSQVHVSGSVAMRWDNLFDDLLGQLDREIAAERADERRDSVRSEIAEIAYRQILVKLAQRGDESVMLRTRATSLVGRVDTVGADWLSFSTRGYGPGDATSAHVVPLISLTALELSNRESVVRATCSVVPHNGDELASRVLSDPSDTARARQKQPRLIDRITFATVLRDLARRRRWVNVTTVDGSVGGTLDAVGHDWCEVAQHARDVARRQSAITGSTLIPLSAVCDVRVD